MNTFIIVLCTTYTVFQILRMFGLFEFNRKPQKVVNVIEDARKSKAKRQREQKLLNLYSTFTNMFRGILLTKYCEERHKFYIDRLDLKTKYLGRKYTPEEYRGKKALPMVLSLLVIPLGVFNTWFLLIPIVTVVRFVTYQTILKQKILDEDTVIDNNFIDLYLLMFSTLRQGSRARLQGILENYIDTLEFQSKSNETEIMLKFSRYFLNLLALYEDHQAVPLLRNSYKSATIINFCNIASQSLQGIDNFDNLITFKMQLIERKTVVMRKKADALVRNGERSIFAIWVILFIFVIVGWYSKLPAGFF